VEQANGFWGKWMLRWRVWRRDPALMETYARQALGRCGVCTEKDSVVRCIRDRASGRLVLIVYLHKFDQAAWSLTRHIELYVMRQFKGLYGITVHSVHLSVMREQAFKETPRMQGSGELRNELRKRRALVLPPTTPVPATTSGTQAAAARASAALSAISPGGQTVAAPRREPTVQEIRTTLLNSDHISTPDFEVSDIPFEEFANTAPMMSQPVRGVAAPAHAESLLDFDVAPASPPKPTSLTLH
jgi:hypothetical protein